MFPLRVVHHRIVPTAESFINRFTIAFVVSNRLHIYTTFNRRFQGFIRPPNRSSIASQSPSIAFNRLRRFQSPSHLYYLQSSLSGINSNIVVMRKFKLERVQLESFVTHLAQRKTKYENSQKLEPSSYMLSNLKAAANNYGKPERGSTGPIDAGEYNNWTEDTNFFKKECGGWNSEYGDFFLSNGIFKCY
ncbi:Glycoside hydrolase, catalytic domain-containing protein [Cynara cardunculus var. scolymus]|uniref:Beta-amylase n=1 Tax=Cynara cardunculus var. scolymus TaxID=59895 RepID=A0A103Y595_CYNCS|nr:Glycoside hydrolase, catalytic domain-containing protein [Cynara cardunculus var. scolymus]